MAEFPFILTYTAFVAPGCGGVARLAVGLTKRGDIAVIHDLPSEYASEEDGSNILIFDPFLLDPVPRSSARGSEFRWGGTVAAVRGWRGVIEHLAANEIVAFGTDGDTDGEYPWPATMELEGEGSVASDLVAAAWSGRPVLGIAQALAGLPDDVLVGLRDRHRSLRSDDTIRPLLRILNKADDLDVPFEDIVARAHRFDFQLPSMLRDVNALGKVIRGEKAAVRRRRAWLLSPFSPRIEAIIMQWRKANPATSANTQIGQSMRAGSLKAFLEAYVLEHGRLPTGARKIEKGHGTPFNMNFDAFTAQS